MLNNIRFVLLNTSHPGNIGATARAMKTMGLSELYLVNPVRFPDEMATAMASRADDILENAKVVASLEEALADCNLVIGSSSDPREIQMPGLTPRQAAPMILEEVERSGPVAVLFGPERSGLTSNELLRCNYHLQIPTNPEYSSLNLAQAVQVMAYELRVAKLNNPDFDVKEDDRKATFGEVDYFIAHLRKILFKIGFLHPENPKKIMPRLVRLFNRTHLEHMEIQLLRGILTKVDEATDGKNLP